jgi:hypothetical protein
MHAGSQIRSESLLSRDRIFKDPTAFRVDYLIGQPRDRNRASHSIKVSRNAQVGVLNEIGGKFIVSSTVDNRDNGSG